MEHYRDTKMAQEGKREEKNKNSATIMDRRKTPNCGQRQRHKDGTKQEEKRKRRK